MNLKILIPYQIFCEKNNVSRIIAETKSGSVGLLPHRLDCVLALSPGILTYQCDSESETYLATDEGVLVKAGINVFISVRQAIQGTNLSNLKDEIQKQFLNLNQDQKSARTMMAKMESGFIHRFAEFQNE